MKHFVLVWVIGLWLVSPAFAQTPLIGPSIGDELQAAGVAGLPFAWNPQTGQVRTDDPRLTEAQRQTIRQVFAAHNPLKPSTEQVNQATKAQSKQDFLDHCTAIEADATLPMKIKRLCTLLKQVIP